MKIVVDGEPAEVAAGLTVAGLLQAREEPARHVLVEVNGEYVAPGQLEHRILVEGDRVEVILPAFGG